MLVMAGSQKKKVTLSIYLKLTAKAPEKIDGCNTTVVFFWEFANFQGRSPVSLREGPSTRLRINTWGFGS